ncbi:hypothetical protein [Halobacillus sp. H74]|uniref:hypothetical protein n=1 Tax=Halobacillus sp. H74 TaxID=3457436 RepID=UPI003FCEC08F
MSNDKRISRRAKSKDIARFLYLLAVIVVSPYLSNEFNIIGALAIALGAYLILLFILYSFNKNRDLE